MKRILILSLLVLSAVLGGCARVPHPTVENGECKAFERPTYAVKGARQYDQDWIDTTVEDGVGACGWKRPAARPPEMDAPKSQTKAKAAVKPKKKRPAWLGFFHRKAEPVPTPTPSPVPYLTPTPVPTPSPVPTPEPAPRRAIDKLLGGGK